MGQEPSELAVRQVDDAVANYCLNAEVVRYALRCEVKEERDPGAKRDFLPSQSEMIFLQFCDTKRVASRFDVLINTVESDGEFSSFGWRLLRDGKEWYFSSGSEMKSNYTSSDFSKHPPRRDICGWNSPFDTPFISPSKMRLNRAHIPLDYAVQFNSDNLAFAKRSGGKLVATFTVGPKKEFLRHVVFEEQFGWMPTKFEYLLNREVIPEELGRKRMDWENPANSVVPFCRTTTTWGKAGETWLPKRVTSESQKGPAGGEVLELAFTWFNADDLDGVLSEQDLRGDFTKVTPAVRSAIQRPVVRLERK